jgi:hypothetical protein
MGGQTVKITTAIALATAATTTITTTQGQEKKQ